MCAQIYIVGQNRHPGRPIGCPGRRCVVKAAPYGRSGYSGLPVDTVSVYSVPSLLIFSPAAGDWLSTVSLP